MANFFLERIDSFMRLSFPHPIWDAEVPPALQARQQAWWDHLGRWVWQGRQWHLVQPPNRLQPWPPLTGDEQYALAQWEALRIPPAPPYPLTVTRDTLSFIRSTPTTWATDLASLSSYPWIGFDVETTGIQIHQDQVRMVQLAAYDPPRDHWHVIVAPVGLWQMDWLNPLRQWIHQASPILVGHNLKFDLNMTRLASDFPRLWDTMIAEQVLSPGHQGSYGLQAVAKKYLQLDMSKTEQTSQWDAETLTEDQWRYAAWDPVVTLVVASHQRQEMYRTGTERVLDLEMQALPAVALMEWTGIAVDRRGIEKNERHLSRMLTQVKEDVEKAWHFPRDLFDGALINLQSDTQLLTHLHQWGFPLEKTESEELAQWQVWAIAKCATLIPPLELQHWMIQWTEHLQQYSPLTTGLTDLWQKGEGQVLDPPRRNHPEYRIWAALPDQAKTLQDFVVGVELLMVYRQYKKYREKWEELLRYAAGGILYPSLMQCVPKGTGRMAASKPNPLNIPHEAVFREVFHPREGYQLLLADYPSIEMKIITWLTGEKTLYDVFQHNGDPHRTMAAAIYQKEPDTITKPERTIGKICNFAFGFGMQGKTFIAHNRHPMFLAGINLQIPEGQTFWQAYHRQYPAIDQWHHTQPQLAEKHRCVHSLLGRPRYWPAGGKISPNETLNTPSQGTGADMLKWALALTARRLAPLGGRVLLAVHDELVCEIPAAHAEEGAKILQDCMEYPAKMILDPIPVSVEVVIADSWAEKA